MLDLSVEILTDQEHDSGDHLDMIESLICQVSELDGFDEDEFDDFEDDDTAFTWHAEAGLDVNLTDQFLISPFYRYDNPVIASVTVLLPFTALAARLGLTRPTMGLLAALGALTLAYVATTELLKRRLARRPRPRADVAGG